MATGSLTLTTSNRLEVLCDALASRLGTEPLDPMTPEVVVVQSPGMEKWLRLGLATRLGVAANLHFPFPNAFLHATLDAVFPGRPPSRPYERESLAWRLVRLLPALRDQPGYGEISEYLAAGEQDDDARLYHLARLLADTFDQYLTYRPDMIRTWEAGQDDDWQARLWRSLADDIEGCGMSRGGHLAGSEAALLARLADASASPATPHRRVSVFGVSVLPPLHLRMLCALSAHATVDLYLMSPSREYWALDLGERARARLERRGVDIGERVGNTLLSSLGKLGADFQDLILSHEPREREMYREPGEDTLLHALQTDILAAEDRATPYTPPEDDDSLRVQSCHSPTREAEALRDFLLDLFDRRPELGPADVLVMTPRISRYAPALEAVLETLGPEGRRIPVAVSDRPPLEQTGLARTVFRILDLPESRCAATEILALAEDPAVRARFGFETDDLELVASWMEAAGIRWGLDAGHRAELDLPPASENTWLAGLDRLLLGYAVSPPEGGLDESLWGGVAPASGAEGSRSEVLGALVELVEAVRSARRRLGERHPLSTWPAVLREVLVGLVGDALEREGEAETIAAALRGLNRSLGEGTAGAEPGAVELGVSAPRAALREGLRQDGGGGRFLTGRLTVCEMLPMRSIPYPVICLVGMNDDVFPGRDRPPGFDRMAREPRKGDRSKSQSDRYLFLETILSARSVLYISYVGQSIRDNATLPPAVPVSMLLDYVEKITGRPGRTLVVKHPLQPFSPVYLSGSPHLYTYSKHDAAAARALATGVRSPRVFCPRPLGPEDLRSIDLAELGRFYRNPARLFVRRRLGFRLERWETNVEDREPFVLRELERHRMGEDLAKLALDGRGEPLPPDAALRALRARGRLPEAEVGRMQLGDLLREVESLRDRVQAYGGRGGVPDRVLTLELDGLTLEAVVPGSRDETIVGWRWGRLRATDMVNAWLLHLAALSLDPPAAAGGTVFVATDRTLEIAPVADAAARLRELAGQYALGMREPLEFFPETSLAYAQAIAASDHASALRKAELKFDPPWGDDRGEAEDPYVRLCFGAQERGPLSTDRFAGLATLVFGPLLAALRVEPRGAA